MESHTFDDVLGLEEEFYNDGFQQGLSDGVKAGQVEGRTFGLEKGFEKYVESGKLFGKSLVWANRLPKSQAHHIGQVQPQLEPASQPLHTAHDDRNDSHRALPSLSHNQRLEKHIKILYAL